MKPQAFIEWANCEGYDTAHTFDTERSVWVFLNPMTADLFRAWGAALDEAIAVCEDHQDPCEGALMADAIRALKGTT